MRPAPTSSIAPSHQWLIRASLGTNSFEEADRLWLQNDRTRTRLPVHAKRPGVFIKVADRASDHSARPSRSPQPAVQRIVCRGSRRSARGLALRKSALLSAPPPLETA